MYTVDQLQEKLRSALNTINYNREPIEIYEPVAYALSQGGKRMRPVLTLLSCDMFGGDVDNAIEAAIGIEIFHNFTLLHDDIMDDAPLRRGKETVYKKWNTNRAILSGDMMMILASKYVSKVDTSLLKDVLGAFNKAAGEVCEGQQYDMNFETAQHISIRDYLKMIRLKTAVLLAASLEIGAIIAGAGNENINKIYKFGENIGLAFQLQDDLLDVYGKQEKFGKKTGGDIVANKKTYLYLKAFELAKGKDLESLTKYYTEKNIDKEAKIRAIKEMYDKLEVKLHVEKEINNYYSEASRMLAEINIPDENKKELNNLADKLLIRDY